MPAAARHSRPTQPETCPVQTGGFARAVLAVLGAALTVAAFGLWLVPAGRDAPSMSLVKLGMSLFMLIGGMCCLVIARASR